MIVCLGFILILCFLSLIMFWGIIMYENAENKKTIKEIFKIKVPIKELIIAINILFMFITIFLFMDWFANFVN